MKKGKILSLLCVGALMIGGFFVSQNINFSLPSPHKTQQIASTSNLNIENISYNETSYEQTYVYDVILVDFNDTTCLGGRLVKTFDEYESTYKHVSELLYELSNHKAKFYFNFYNSKLDMSAKDLTHSRNKLMSDFAETYDNIMDNKQVLQHNYGAGITILQFASLYSVQYEQFAWPSWFNFVNSSFNLQWAIRIIDETDFTVISHELLHSIGLPDLYSNANRDECSLRLDILSTYRGTPAILNAYHKKQLGWISSSDYDDETQTEIENITESGRYRIYFPENLNQTVAYTFGKKGQEVFYIEARDIYTAPLLAVNRVNTAKKSNFNATKLSECMVAEVANIQKFGNQLISVNGAEILKNKVYYSSGEVANYAIGNVEYFDDYIEFDFSTAGDFSFQVQINVVDDTTASISNAQVFINDNYVGLTNNFGKLTYTVLEDDKITVLHPQTKDAISCTVKGNEKDIYFTFESLKQQPIEQSKPQIDTKPKQPTTEIFTLNLSLTQKLDNAHSHLNYFYIDNNTFNNSTQIQVYVDGKLVQNGFSKTCVVSLKNNSKIEIFSSSTSASYIYEASSKTLKNTATNARIYCQNNTFSINLNIPTIMYNFYLYYDDNINKRAGIKHVKAFNGNTGIWENLTCISDKSEYSPMPVYLTTDYISIEIEYQNWYEWNTVSFTLNPTQSEYYARLSENIIQSGLDWWSDLLGLR